jgi:hypothetical protein
MLEAKLEWDDLDRAFAELEAEVSDVVRGITVEAWNLVLLNTPQYYGRMVASWTYSLNSPVFVDRSLAMPNDGDPYDIRQKGHPEGIGIANFASLGRDYGFKLGMSVWFANGVDHGEGPYSQDVEDGKVSLRPENRPGNAVGQAIDTMSVRHTDGVISLGKKIDLAAMRVGESYAG